MQENRVIARNPSILRSAILETLQKHNGLTISDVSRVLGIHYTTASKYLAVMEAENLVTHRQIGMAKLFSLDNQRSEASLQPDGVIA